MFPCVPLATVCLVTKYHTIRQQVFYNYSTDKHDALSLTHTHPHHKSSHKVHDQAILFFCMKSKFHILYSHQILNLTSITHAEAQNTHKEVSIYAHTISHHMHFSRFVFSTFTTHPTGNTEAQKPLHKYLLVSRPAFYFTDPSMKNLAYTKSTLQSYFTYLSMKNAAKKHFHAYSLFLRPIYDLVPTKPLYICMSK
jgi:hypothetical protein